jgi:poly(3-hydroxybutyrate) depolymerase
MRPALSTRALALCACAAGLHSAAATAVQTVFLPAWVCAHPDAIFANGFEAGPFAVPSDPSNGSGGALGSITRNVHVAGLGSGTQTYFLYVPDSYTPSKAWPLLLALHGVAPYPDSYAAMTRDDWSTVANAGQFIVAAPVAHDVVDVSGTFVTTWLVPPTSGANDYDQFAAIRTDLENAYNIERTRVYGWGFSAGGHVMHDLGVTTQSSAFNASTMAAYGVSAGDLAGLACAGLSNTECNQLLAAVPRKIPLDIHVGISDPNFGYAQSDHTRFVAQGWTSGQTIFYTTFVGGHEYTVTQLGEIWHNLCPNAVTP